MEWLLYLILVIIVILAIEMKYVDKAVDIDSGYQCSCGVWVPYEEATRRMINHCHCEVCDNNRFE